MLIVYKQVLYSEWIVSPWGDVVLKTDMCMCMDRLYPRPCCCEYVC
jgi:hypothetical protein